MSSINSIYMHVYILQYHNCKNLRAVWRTCRQTILFDAVNHLMLKAKDQRTEVVVPLEAFSQVKEYYSFQWFSLI